MLPTQVGARLARGGGGVVEPRLGSRLFPDQLRLTPPLELGAVQRRLRARDRGLDVLDLRAVGRLLDHEEEVARLHLLALSEQLLLEEALDTGAQIDLVHGLDPSREAGGRGDVAPLDLEDRDGRGGGAARLLGCCRAGEHGNSKNERNQRRVEAGCWCSGHAVRPLWACLP